MELATLQFRLAIAAIPAAIMLFALVVVPCSIVIMVLAGMLARLN
jgi:hypothetical protein